jgi:acyl carrier protein
VSDVKETLRTFVCAELIGDPSYPLTDDEPLMSDGLIDSFALAHIAVFIEDTFGVYIPDVDLVVEEFDTLEQIAARVARG